MRTFLYLCLFTCFACNKDTAYPYVPVQVQFDVNFYPELSYPQGRIYYPTVGQKGLIVFNNSDLEFLVYDRLSLAGCVLEFVPGNTWSVQDPCNQETYNLILGYSDKDPNRRLLKYNTYFDGTRLFINN